MARLIGSQILKFNASGLPYFEELISKDGKTANRTLEECGYVKSLSGVKIVIKREGFSEKSFTKKVAFFLTELTYEIPQDLREFRNCYFYYEPKTMTNICVKSFASKEGYCFDINPMDRDFLKSRSKLVRVTENEVLAMLQNRQILGVFSEAIDPITRREFLEEIV